MSETPPPQDEALRTSIGLIGCGAIGTIIARALDKGQVPAKLLAVNDINHTRAEQLIWSLQRQPTAMTLAGMIATCDFIVEATTPQAVGGIVEQALQGGRDILAMSVAGLLDREDLFEMAERFERKIYLPAGALAGIDAARAAAVGTVESVILSTRKPPRALAGAPELLKKGIDPLKVTEPTVVFEGTAREAIRGFPLNVNVAATLSLACGGADFVQVRIIADPTVDKNIHELEIIGDCGRILSRTENVPSSNPKTSQLAAYSAIAALRQILKPLVIGA